MKKFNLIDDLGFVTTGVEEYQGEKNYYSTGSIKEFVNNAEGKFSYKNRPSRANRCVQEGDVLQARMQNTQKAILIDDNYSGSLFSTGFFQLRPPRNLVDSKYIYYCLQTKWFQNLKDSLCSGATQKSINDKKLKEINFFLPPLPEQKRIVAKLDKAFAEIGSADLTLRNNVKNANAIFEKKIEEYFVDNIFNAEVYPLSKFSTYFNGLTYSPKDVADSGVIVLRSSNIQNGEMHYADIKRVKKNIKEKLFVKEDDILLCSRNGSKRLIGKSSLIGKIKEPMTFGTFMMIVRSDCNHYLQWFFKSKLFKKQISQGEDNMINQITRYMLDDVSLPLPSEDLQKKVNENLKDLDYLSRKLIKIYSSKMANFEKLKQAILKQELKSEAV